MNAEDLDEKLTTLAAQLLPKKGPCPVCGKPATGFGTFGAGVYAVCENEHEWSGAAVEIEGIRSDLRELTQ